MVENNNINNNLNENKTLFPHLNLVKLLWDPFEGGGDPFKGGQAWGLAKCAWIANSNGMYLETLSRGRASDECRYPSKVEKGT